MAMKTQKRPDSDTDDMRKAIEREVSAGGIPRELSEVHTAGAVLGDGPAELPAIRIISRQRNLGGAYDAITDPHKVRKRIWARRRSKIDRAGTKGGLEATRGELELLFRTIGTCFFADSELMRALVGAWKIDRAAVLLYVEDSISQRADAKWVEAIARDEAMVDAHDAVVSKAKDDRKRALNVTAGKVEKGRKFSGERYAQALKRAGIKGAKAATLQRHANRKLGLNLTRPSGL